MTNREVRQAINPEAQAKVAAYFQGMDVDAYFGEQDDQEGAVSRNTAIAAMLAEGYSQEQATEYADEAEHQDGDEYWEQFETLADVMDDVKLYWENHD